MWFNWSAEFAPQYRDNGGSQVADIEFQFIDFTRLDDYCLEYNDTID